MRMRFSLSRRASRVRSRIAVDEDGDLDVVLLELVDGLGGGWERLVEEVADGGFRASRQAAVRGEGSSSENM